jgi:hypothetical protein
MNNSDFVMVLVDDNRMILCRNKDLEKVNTKALIKKAFPGLFADKIWLEKILEKNGYRIERCYEAYSSKFDCQVDSLEQENDWDANPFIALNVFQIDDVSYCRAKSIKIGGSHGNEII